MACRVQPCRSLLSRTAVVIPILAAAALVGIRVHPVSAGPNAGGTLILHANTSLVYTDENEGYCGQSGLTSCEQAVTTMPADPDTTIIFHALAAFPSGSNPRLMGLEFGIDYDSERLVVVDQGMCGVFELPDTDWPEPGSGTAIVMGSAATGLLTEVCWFVAYASDLGDTTSFSVRPHLGHGGSFADDSIPAVLDPIAAYGRLGFGTAGVLPCPTSVPGGPEDPEEPEGSGESPASPTSSVLMPSTDTSPFHKVDIYADRIDSTGLFRNHWSPYGYPNSLRDSSLLVIRDYQDTVAVCDSHANDHVILEWSSAPAGLTFEVDPPRRATSLHLLSTIDVATPGDGGHPISLVTLTDENAQTLTDTLSIGSELRCAWKHDCEADLYSQHPTNPLCGEVWSDTHVYGDSAYYDVQEIALPPEWRSRRITEIEISQHVQHDYCCRHDCVGGILQTWLVLSGASFGTDFHIETASGDSVETQRQYDQAWATRPYGGRVVAGDSVGTWRTIQSLGCYLTCFSMISEFYGTGCTPDDLNAFARNSRLYDPLTRARVDWLTGQDLGDTVTVTVTPEGRGAFRQGDRLLLEHEGQPEAPVAVIAMIPPYSGSARRGVIERRFAVQDTLIGEGDLLRSYSLLNPHKLNRYGGVRRYAIQTVWPSTEDAVSRIEEAMALERPVVIHTNFLGGVPQHWVVADGMRPRFDVSGQDNHRGTYRIHDPGSEKDDLLDDPYLNKIGRAVLTEPINLLDDDEEEGALVLTLSGSAVLGITDPLGRRLSWSPETGGYESNIAGCSVLPGYSIGEEGDSIPDFVVDFVEIAEPLNGDYLMEVFGTGTDGFALNIGAHDVYGGYRSAFRTDETSEGGLTYFLVSYDQCPDSALVVEELDPAGAPAAPSGSRSLEWSVSPNPAKTGADIVFFLESALHVKIRVFDASGRTVARLVDVALPQGPQRVRWEGLTDDGRAVGCGVYFVRMDAGGRRATKKLVCVR